MDANYKIEKGIPIPRKRGEKSKYPFFEMEPEDSFEVKITSGNTTSEKLAMSIRNCYNNACKYNKDMKDWKFTVRVLSDTSVRCWRVK
jgi:ribosomal protein S1